LEKVGRSPGKNTGKKPVIAHRLRASKAIEVNRHYLFEISVERWTLERFAKKTKADTAAITEIPMQLITRSATASSSAEKPSK
jgi:hypothetical protein